MNTTANNNKDYANGQSNKATNDYKLEIVWRNVVTMIALHAIGLYGLYATVIGAAKWSTFVWYYVVAYFGSLGVQAGAHRLWSHRSYKAKLPLRVLLAILQTIALQNHIYEWSRDHRVHHKYTETDADPHNALRGFFFCHMGWLLCRKHPEVRQKGKTIYTADLWDDPVVRFQAKHYLSLVLIFWAIIPTVVPMYFFGESFLISVSLNAFRYVYSLHVTWTVNSVAHLWGMRPYDKWINPRDSPLVIYWGMGEGYHNYHHVFPYDYSASEFGWKVNWNPATAFIDFFARIGWAYDLKTAPSETVVKRLTSTGDPIDKTNKFGKLARYWTDFFVGLFATTFLLNFVFVLRNLFHFLPVILSH